MTTKKTELMPAIDDGLRNILTQETPPEVVKKRKGKGGKVFSYVEHAWVTRQLNTAFNWGWSWEVVEWQILPSLSDALEVFVLGRLTVHTPNGDIVKMQFGTKEVNRNKQTGTPLSLGDDLKAASSDGLKKAASLLGLALDLYKSDAPPDDDEGNLGGDPMTAYWAAAKAKGLTQADGAALLTKHKGNPDKALIALTKPNGNGTEKAKADFFARVLAEIPYYEHVKHVTNALKQAGYTTYAQSKEDEMFAALETHAQKAANKEAA